MLTLWALCREHGLNPYDMVSQGDKGHNKSDTDSHSTVDLGFL